MDVPGTTDGPRTKRLYHGTRTDLSPGDRIEPYVVVPHRGGAASKRFWASAHPCMEDVESAVVQEAESDELQL